MKKQEYVLAYGTTTNGKKIFDGEKVLILDISDEKSIVKIYHLEDETEYEVHKKQLEAMEWLYPLEIYVRDSSLDYVNTSEPAICEVPKHANVANTMII